MKLKKRLIGVGLALAAAVLLTACGKTATDAKTYSSTFGADPTTFNYLLDYSGDNTAVITTSGFTPKNIGFHNTISAILPTSNEPI